MTCPVALRWGSYFLVCSPEPHEDGGDLGAGSAALKGQQPSVVAGDQALAHGPAQGLHGVAADIGAVPERGQGAVPGAARVAPQHGGKLLPVMEPSGSEPSEMPFSLAQAIAFSYHHSAAYGVLPIKAGQHGHQHGAGHGAVGAEGGLAGAGEQLMGGRKVNGVIRPVALWCR